MTPLPTLRQLQFFMALVRRESFSKAAEDCFVSQSTLSAAIKELETLLQAQLVDRSTRKFALTPVGEDIAARAKTVLALSEDLVHAAASRRPMEGPFHLGVIPTIAPFLLPKVAPKLKKAFPQLELYLREDQTAKLVDRLASGDIDAALLALPYELPGMDVMEIGDDPFVFAAAPGHPLLEHESVTPADLKNARLLLLEEGHCLRDHALDACHLQDPSFGAAYSATSLFTLAQMVQSGLGATLLPQMAVDAGLAKASGLKTLSLAEPAPARRLGIAWRSGSSRREEAETIGAFFEKQLS